MRSLLLFGMCTTALAMASPALAESTDFAKVGDWEINRDAENGSCMLSKFNTKGNALLITFSPFDNSTALSFLVFDGANFKDNSKQRLTIYIFAGDSDSSDLGWGAQEFSFSDPGLEDRPNARLVSFFTEDGEKLLTDLSKGKVMGAQTSAGRFVAASPLQGSAPAIAKLRECAYSLSPPSD